MFVDDYSMNSYVLISIGIDHNICKYIEKYIPNWLLEARWYWCSLYYFSQLSMYNKYKLKLWKEWYDIYLASLEESMHMVRKIEEVEIGISRISKSSFFHTTNGKYDQYMIIIINTPLKQWWCHYNCTLLSNSNVYIEPGWNHRSYNISDYLLRNIPNQSIYCDNNLDILHMRRKYMTDLLGYSNHYYLY